MPELAWIALETDPMKSMGITPPRTSIPATSSASARTSRPLAPTASPK
jgi:hypothetical protein